MSRFCIGETLSAVEKNLVANIFVFQKIKNQNIDYINNTKILIREYHILIDFKQISFKNRDVNCFYCSDLFENLNLSVGDITKEYFENFLYDLLLPIKEYYDFDEIMQAICIKQIIIKENIIMNMHSLKMSVSNFDRASEGILKYFFDGRNIT